MSNTNSQEIYETIEKLFEEFQVEHSKGTKASAARARKAIGEIKKLITDYRKLSVDENR